jgi:hypothetical protein
MSPTAAPDAAVVLEEEFVVPVDLGITDNELLGNHRCCGCNQGACCNLVGGDCRWQE